MGQSLNGKIGYGILFNEYAEFPWGEDGVEEWWAKLHGWRGTGGLYNEDGSQNELWSEEEFSKRYDERDPIMEAHPIPVELEMCGVGDNCTEVMVIPGSYHSSGWGGTSFDPAKLKVSKKELKAFNDFVSKYLGDVYEDDDDDNLEAPTWILFASYW